MSLPKPYYQDSAVTLYHGDCRELVPLLGRFDAIITDPPYGVYLGARANNNRERESYHGMLDGTDEVWTMLEGCWPIFTAATDRIILTPGLRLMFRYPTPKHVGSIFYPAGSGCNSWGFSCWQPIFYYGKDPYAGKGSRPDSFTSTEPAEINGHPCPKPIGQMTWMVNRGSLEGQTVLDPFAGSGTTGRACKDLGRKCVMIEREEKYCEIAARRMGQEVLNLS